MCQSVISTLLFFTERLNIFTGSLETLQLLFYILEIPVGVRYETFTDILNLHYSMCFLCFMQVTVFYTLILQSNIY